MSDWWWSAPCVREGESMDLWRGVQTHAVERAVKAQSIKARALARQFIPKG